MSDPSPHELPSALSSLFDSPHHFLPAGGDDILIDPQLVSGAATPIETASPVVEVDERERERERERLPRNDGSALDVALVSLAAENERLRRAIAALESGSADSISEAALRELATATVSGSVGPGVGIGVGVGVGVGFGFETLQHQLEQHVQPLDEGSLAGGTSEVAATDFLHGLVTQVSSPSVAPPKSTDPFELTRRALEADIARTREAIAEKEAEIAGVRAGTAPAAPPTDDAAALEAQLSKTATLTETLRRNVGVLRDMAARLQAQHDELREDVDDKAAHLALLEEDARVSADGAAALLEVRGYIEGALKLWRDRGQLPPIPVPQLPVLVRAETLAPPPSALPKKRGRPPRSTPKPSVLPPALAHLVPDAQTVKARELETPLRRKGIKRGKLELEREKQREEEEGEMLRSLVGMGVWSRESVFEPDV